MYLYSTVGRPGRCLFVSLNLIDFPLSTGFDVICCGWKDGVGRVLMGWSGHLLPHLHGGLFFLDSMNEF